MTVEEAWSRIEDWSQEHAPDINRSLRKGATEEEICNFEEKLGQKLPDSFRRSLKVHDGQVFRNPDADILAWLFWHRDNYRLLPLSDIKIVSRGWQ